LSRSKAGGFVARFAFDSFGIEVAAGRIFEQAILCTVGSVAGFQHGLVNDGVFAGWNVIVRIENALRQPDLPGREMRSWVGGSARYDAIVIVWKPLRFFQALPAAGGTSIPIGHAGSSAIEGVDHGLRLERHFVNRSISEIDQLLGMARDKAAGRADAKACDRAGYGSRPTH